MSYLEEYKLWSTDPFFDEGTRSELAAIKDDAKEIEDRFYRDLEFGTAGLRGVLGAGTNRMNVYTVAKASEGLAKYILSEGEDAIKRGVVISYDSRHFSPEFSKIAAQTFAPTLIAGGVPALSAGAMIHAGATVVDSLPHGSFFHATGGSVNMSIGDRMKLIPFEACVGLTSTIVSVILFLVFG